MEGDVLKRVFAASAAIAAFACAAAAAAAGPSPAPEAEAALARLRAGAGAPVLVTRHAGSARVRTLQGALSPPGEGAPGEIADRFLREQAALFGLREGAGDLELASLRESPGGTHLAYRQTAGGLPVFNGGVEVTLDRERRVFLVASEYAPAGGVDPSPTLDATAAASVARDDLRGSAAPTPASGTAAAMPATAGPPLLGVFLADGTPRLAWRLVLESRVPFAVVEFTIDAHVGSILQRRDLVQRIYRNGWGRVFNPNPVNTLRSTALRDAADADGAAFAAAYLKVQLRGLTYNAATGRYQLRGPHVNVTDWKQKPQLFPATKGVVFSRTPSFLFGRTPEQFEHVMVYHHIDVNQRYIQTLGFANVNRRSIVADPHGLSGANASSYVAQPVGAGYLAFGSGGIDDAEDADVILHEYAHAIQDNQAPGKYLGTATEAAAMGEGFADYWAASSTYDLSVKNGFDPACVGEWNAAPGCVDRVDSAKKYTDAVGDAQADGQIWSAALWDIFQATGDRGATDRIVLESHFLVPANPTFSDGGDALVLADTVLFNGIHEGQICSVLTARGLPTTRCRFSATVTWDNLAVDLDLHLRPPDGAAYAGWDYARDCSSHNPNPEWGFARWVPDNPLLKSDCRYDCTEEQIILSVFYPPGLYGILVHAYGQTGWMPQSTTAEIRVYRGGALLYSGTQTLSNVNNRPDEGTLWKAYTVDVVF